MDLDINKTVARLKATAEVERTEGMEEGRDAGREWAADKASPRQLRPLGEYEFCSHAHNWETLLTIFSDRHNDGVAIGLFRVLHPWAEADLDDIEDFWCEALGEGGVKVISDPYFALGFVEGALE